MEGATMARRKFNYRQKNLYRMLDKLGGMATTKQIASIAKLEHNAVSKSLGMLSPYVISDGKGDDGSTKWRIDNHLEC